MGLHSGEGQSHGSAVRAEEEEGSSSFDAAGAGEVDNGGWGRDCHIPDFEGEDSFLT